MLPDELDDEMPEEAGEIDWDNLSDEELEDDEDEVFDASAIAAEKENLSEDEKDSPYPDDFLADWNLLRKSIDEETERTRKKK